MSLILEEKDAIREMLAKYCYFSDSMDTENFESLWAEDAVLIGPDGTKIEGRQAISEMISAGGKSLLGTMKHLTTNEIISVTGDTATAMCTILVPTQSGNGKIMLKLTGIYRDKLRKLDGVWVFGERAVELVLINADV